VRAGSARGSGRACRQDGEDALRVVDAGVGPWCSYVSGSGAGEGDCHPQAFVGESTCGSVNRGASFAERVTAGHSREADRCSAGPVARCPGWPSSASPPGCWPSGRRGLAARRRTRAAGARPAVARAGADGRAAAARPRPGPGQLDAWSASGWPTSSRPGSPPIPRSTRGPRAPSRAPLQLRPEDNDTALTGQATLARARHDFAEALALTDRSLASTTSARPRGPSAATP
jgi:hypothetical protein